MLKRREFLIRGALAGASLALLPSAWAASAPNTRQRPRLVLVILRGGLDGLHAVPPLGDPGYAALRGDVALRRDGADAALALGEQGLFGLHPLLPELARRYASGELLIQHAVAGPYRDRSHFDAQDILETGVSLPRGRSDGWLNRALGGLPGRGEQGIALSTSLPLVLRGPTAVGNWSPSPRAAPQDDFLARVERLYASDPALAAGLLRAREIHGAAETDGMERMGGKAGAVSVLSAAAARFLREPDGPSAAVLAFGGWDSHTAAFTPQGGLSRSLRQLNAGLTTLREELGAVWQHSAVLVVTEFGRTVRPNGSGGTDHGTATCSLLLGGAVRGGRVLADWPGLGSRDLHEQRDLRATGDLRALCKGLLIEHLRLPESLVEQSAFPDSRAIRPLTGLLRSPADQAA